MHQSKDRFDYYRGIEARFASTGSCGHPIAKGDRIGFNPSVRDEKGQKKTQCASCWAKWTAENEEADRLEAMSGCAERFDERSDW